MTIRIRNGPSYTKVALTKLLIDAANKELRVGKIKADWYVYRMSISQQPEVCFKCHGVQHEISNDLTESNFAKGVARKATRLKTAGNSRIA